MGIFKKIFGRKKETYSRKDLTISKKSLDSQMRGLSIHPDVQDLIWIADGPKRNFILQNKEQILEYDWLKIRIYSFSSLEPSLISTRLPIEKNIKVEEVEGPPYYPMYAQLTAAQRGVYWKMLENPYTGQFDIGFIFILYYGLERHLIEGNFEEAFDVILKLRNIYSNKSFQHYSAGALIITCLIRKRVDLLEKLYQSLDKKFKLNFSDNLYLLCKMGLGVPLTPADMIRMAKSFGFKNQNYIKKYPDLFLTNLTALTEKNFGKIGLEISEFITPTQYKKLRKQDEQIFANLSIRDQTVGIPLLLDCLNLKKEVNDLLEQAHANVKKELAEMRKNGLVPLEKKSSSKKRLPIFDKKKEIELLQNYNNSEGDAISKHFALISLQDFYYKYRDVDVEYLNMCIDYCYEDIELLAEVQHQHIQEEKNNLQRFSEIYSEEELREREFTNHAFKGRIPAFKRLAIIYEKRKNYFKAIEICEQAIVYYNNILLYDSADSFRKRKIKIEKKLTT